MIFSTMVGHRPFSSMSTGCVVPLRRNLSLFHHAGSGRVVSAIIVWKISWIEPKPQSGQRPWDTFIFPLSYHDGGGGKERTDRDIDSSSLWPINDCDESYITAAEDVCVLPKPVHTFMCEKLTRRYYFDSKRGRCRKFWGCDEITGNSFDTKKECRKQCMSEDQILGKRLRAYLIKASIRSDKHRLHRVWLQLLVHWQ